MAYLKIIAGAFVVGLFILTLVLASQLRKANNEIGVLTHSVEVNQEAVKILAKDLAKRDQQIKQLEGAQAEAYEACQSTAAASDSSAFNKGVEVGKVLGAKMQCPAISLPSLSAPR